MTDYTAETTNASNKVTAVTSDPEAEIVIKVNGSELVNGTAASWNDGTNIVTITVSKAGTKSGTYNVTVTKN